MAYITKTLVLSFVKIEKKSYRDATGKRKIFMQDVIKCLLPVLSSERSTPIQHLIQENSYSMEMMLADYENHVYDISSHGWGYLNEYFVTHFLIIEILNIRDIPR